MEALEDCPTSSAKSKEEWAHELIFEAFEKTYEDGKRIYANHGYELAYNPSTTIDAYFFKKDREPKLLLSSMESASSYHEKPVMLMRAQIQEKVWNILDTSVFSVAKFLVFDSPENIEEQIEETPYSSKIIAAIFEEPVENGYDHPAEELLRASLVNYPVETARWLFNIVSNEKNSSLVASILKCLGSIDAEVCKGWGIDVVKKALEHHDVEVRDAAVQILEEWELKEGIELLKEYKRREPVSWLRDYMEDIIEDLECY